MRKKYSLKKPDDFKNVFKKGKRLIEPYFVLYTLKNALPESRLGVSIAKAHFKLATRRNRLRRVARELFRKTIFPSIKGHDFVLTSRAGYSKPDLKEALINIKRLIARTSL